jgi:hypothetical protein
MLSICILLQLFYTIFFIECILLVRSRYNIHVAKKEEEDNFNNLLECKLALL